MTVFTGAQHAHFSLQGDKIIIIDQHHSAKIYNLLGQLLAVLDDQHLIGDALFDPSGKLIETAGLNGMAKLWSNQGNWIATCRHNMCINTIRFSPDGNSFLTSSSDRTAKLWNLKGCLEASYRHRHHVNSAEFDTTGRLIVTTSEDKTAKVWKRDGNIFATFKHHKPVRMALFNRAGTYVLMVVSHLVIIAHISGEEIASLSHDDLVDNTEFDHRTDRIMTTSGNITRIWDSNGSILDRFAGKNARFNVNADTIATISNDTTVNVLKQPILLLTLPETIALLTLHNENNQTLNAIVAHSHNQTNFNDKLKLFIREKYKINDTPS